MVGGGESTPMNRTNAIRLITAALSAALLAGYGLAQDGPDEVIYLEGTVREIPWSTDGRLTLNESDGLVFEFGTESFRVPPEQVTSYKWAKEIEGFGEHLSAAAAKLGQTLMPMAFHKERYLTVYFRKPAARHTDRLTFTVSKQLREVAEPVLQAWVAKNRSNPAMAVAFAEDDDAWWGNRYWKTHRNRHLWEARKANVKEAGKVEVAAREEE